MCEPSNADTPRDNCTNPIIVTWCFTSPRQQYRFCVQTFYGGVRIHKSVSTVIQVSVLRMA